MTNNNEGAGMAMFNVGDKVRIHDRGYASEEWVGSEGIVTDALEFSNSLNIKLTKATAAGRSVGSTATISKNNLELIEFTFKDIQKGDLIRRTFTRSDGSKVIWEGVAVRVNHDKSTWLTLRDFPLAHKEDNDHTDLTIELLERPKPKHWSLEKPVGSVGLSGEGVNKRIWKKIGDDAWTINYIISTPTRTAYDHEYIQREFPLLEAERLEWLK